MYNQTCINGRVDYSRHFTVRLSGDFACFTIPATQAAKISYEVPTVPAIQGILHSFAWFVDKANKEWADYEIDQIYILNPIKTTNLKFNFAQVRPSRYNPDKNYFCDMTVTGKSVRTQVNQCALINPDYVIRGRIVGTSKEIVDKQYSSLVYRVINACPYNPPRFGTKFLVTDYRWLGGQFNPKDFKVPEGLENRIIYNYLVSKNYNPCINTIEDSIQYTTIPSITIKNGVIDFTKMGRGE